MHSCAAASFSGTGRRKLGLVEILRVPSSEMPPPGTIMCTCGLVRNRRAPGVQHGGDADPGPEMLCIRCDHQHRLGCCLEQQIVDNRLEGDGAELRRVEVDCRAIEGAGFRQPHTGLDAEVDDPSGLLVDVNEPPLGKVVHLHEGRVGGDSFPLLPSRNADAIEDAWPSTWWKSFTTE